MAYNKTIWKDRTVQNPRNYTITNNPDGTITLTPTPGTVTEQGTPITATVMNNIEKGIVDLDVKMAEKVHEKKLTYTSPNANTILNYTFGAYLFNDLDLNATYLINIKILGGYGDVSHAIYATYVGYINSAINSFTAFDLIGTKHKVGNAQDVNITSTSLGDVTVTFTQATSAIAIFNITITKIG
ncbi:hypothetical protein [Clostridium sp.]|uniref:hypothetical protein n=1 Tax=Clostridium sp. TaxID=1506 RepID=UPI00261377F8|nr:hypothetical protein [Clostridium sp.]